MLKCPPKIVNVCFTALLKLVTYFIVFLKLANYVLLPSLDWLFIFYCPPKNGKLFKKLKPRVLYLYHHNSPEHILPGSCSDFSEAPSAINCAKPCTVSCPQPGSLECLQESIIDRGGFEGTCCCGQCDVDMMCAADDSSSNGVWKPLYPTICPEGGCGDKGESLRKPIS